MKGKGFTSRRKAGGWVAIAVAVAGAYAQSQSEEEAGKEANKMKYEDQRDLSNISFQQNEWLQEQARKWQQQDKQFDLNYKEKSIGGFRDAAPANSLGGEWGPPPAETQLDTSGLARTQPNGQAAIIDPRTGQPMNSNAPPLSQFGG